MGLGGGGWVHLCNLKTPCHERLDLLGWKGSLLMVVGREGAERESERDLCPEMRCLPFCQIRNTSKVRAGLV